MRGGVGYKEKILHPEEGHWNRVPRKVITAPAQQSARSIWTTVLGTWCDSWDGPA